MVLAEQAGKSELIPPGLTEVIYRTVQALWETEPAWQWERRHFAGGIRERVAWKLQPRDVKWRYYRAIIAHELFLFAIAADLRAHERLSNIEVQSAMVAQILSTARTAIEQRIVAQDGGGWLFQPGIWSDHPDYAYVAVQNKVPGMKPSPMPDIAEDTSHSDRWPLWLVSLANAYVEGDHERAFYDNLKKGLETQFFETVLVAPTAEFPMYRTNNFMDGWNGVYRWEYETQGRNNGYGPYELSGTLTLGWWTFLDTSRIRAVYQDMASQFPLHGRVIEVYVGPNTSRERHPLVTKPDAYQNGLVELTVRLAGKLDF